MFYSRIIYQANQLKFCISYLPIISRQQPLTSANSYQL